MLQFFCFDKLPSSNFGWGHNVSLSLSALLKTQHPFPDAGFQRPLEGHGAMCGCTHAMCNAEKNPAPIPCTVQ
eukprot:1157822-Amphidinium_carterae.1